MQDNYSLSDPSLANRFSSFCYKKFMFIATQTWSSNSVNIYLLFVSTPYNVDFAYLFPVTCNICLLQTVQTRAISCGILQ